MTTTSKTAAPEFTELPMDKVLPHPRNVRRRLTGIDELAASLKAEGLHQPLVVAPQDDGYVVVMGNRRRAAAESRDPQALAAVGRRAVAAALLRAGIGVFSLALFVLLLVFWA